MKLHAIDVQNLTFKAQIWVKFVVPGGARVPHPSPPSALARPARHARTPKGMLLGWLISSPSRRRRDLGVVWTRLTSLAERGSCCGHERPRSRRAGVTHLLAVAQRSPRVEVAE